jgi:NADH-quinone oxidoreductase subunit G
MIIQASDNAGIYIPRFCYHEKLSIAANCRMCLVEVEKAPKPLPACATPVAEGMVVKTASKTAVEAQKGTMEFLLINHPLDCPVCDQGGECPLQDQALGYGGGVSRFSEEKRAVENPDIGPLIETEMTRCIHCTRCVRFGQEIAGVMEFGAIGRSEDMKITTFMEGSVDSEVSGNNIDLCPVGALTSKPYRFTARSWEMHDHPLISPHDCLGSNLIAQSVGGEVKRVLPRTNEAVNECWLSDRDRFSYEAVNSNDRLTQPLVKKDERMEEVSWEEALGTAADSLRKIVDQNGADALGALCTPTATLEEFYLLQKLIRGLGCQNIDHRLRQQDFRDDETAPIFPGSEIPVAQVPQLSAALVIGCNLRKELPLVALRFRELVRNGGRVAALNPIRFDSNFSLATDWVIAPRDMPAALACVAQKLAKERKVEFPAEIEALVRPDLDIETAREVARLLMPGKGTALLVLGQLAAQHAEAADLRGIASWMASHCGLRMAVLPDANSAAGWIAGCVPHRGAGGDPMTIPGRDAARMTTDSLSGCVLYGLEPSLDYGSPGSLDQTLGQAEFVLSFSSFRSAVPPQANVVFPLVPYTENSGSFINLEGRLQFSPAAVQPQGEARPGWKILRVLANFLELKGFDYVTVGDVTQEIPLSDLEVSYRLAGALPKPRPEGARSNDRLRDGSLERILDVPLYSVDPVVRRADSLQATRDNPPSAAHVHPRKLAELGLEAGQVVAVRGTEGTVRLLVQPDDRVLESCAYIPAARPETAALGNSETIWLDVGS